MFLSLIGISFYIKNIQILWVMFYVLLVKKEREGSIRKELADSISNLDFYDYPKTIAKFKKEEEKK